jgi:hypothetical protein
LPPQGRRLKLFRPNNAGKKIADQYHSKHDSDEVVHLKPLAAVGIKNAKPEEND